MRLWKKPKTKNLGVTLLIHASLFCYTVRKNPATNLYFGDLINVDSLKLVLAVSCLVFLLETLQFFLPLPSLPFITGPQPTKELLFRFTLVPTPGSRVSVYKGECAHWYQRPWHSHTLIGAYVCLGMLAYRLSAASSSQTNPLHLILHAQISYAAAKNPTHRFLLYTTAPSYTDPPKQQENRNTSIRYIRVVFNIHPLGG